MQRFSPLSGLHLLHLIGKAEALIRLKSFRGIWGMQYSEASTRCQRPIPRTQASQAFDLTLQTCLVPQTLAIFVLQLPIRSLVYFSFFCMPIPEMWSTVGQK